ncbi:MAG: DUF1266 domain-containing protein [Planctomycetota bacterium]
MSDKTPSDSDPNGEIVTGTKAWALGCSAVLIERNHGRHDILGTRDRTDKNIKKMKKFLIVSGWEVKNRADLLADIQWLEEGGHREEFDLWSWRIEKLDAEGYKQLLDHYLNDPNTLNRIKVTEQYHEQLGKKGLLGWDYSRIICLCRWGYMAGYITEGEAWQRIMPVARTLQDTFDSWEDLGQNYLIGRRFWSLNKTKQEEHLYDDAYQRLLDMPSSPWNKHLWTMPLGAPESSDEAYVLARQAQGRSDDS